VSKSPIQPATADRVADLDRLFAANGTVGGCWCAYFLVSNADFEAGWRAGNRKRLLDVVRHGDAPAGLLAYRDGEPVGWCATGPRDRYARVLRSPHWKQRDRAEDATVWLIPCLFVHRDARRHGLTLELLAAAVDLAREHGAPAVEGLPLAGDGPHPSADAYVGTESMFAATGFRVVHRPSNRRVRMRLDLT